MANMTRPYYPRVQNRPQSTSADWQRGEQAGGQVGKLIGAFADAINQAKQNKVANQLLNQQYPGTSTPQGNDPDPDPVNQDTGAPITDPNAVVPDVGLPDITTPGNLQGGVAELQMRQAAAKEDLDTQIKKAQLADYIAKAAGTGGYAKARGAGTTIAGGSSSRWLSGGGSTGGTTSTTRGGKPAPYQAGSGDVENDEETDSFDQIRADFDDQHGKGSFDAFQAQGGGTKNDDGSYSITDKNGKPLATVQGADVPLWMQRVNAARLKRGQTPMGSLGNGSNPNSTSAPGSADNPIIAQSKVHVRSLPYGAWVKDPNTGQVYQKQRPPA